MINHCKGRGYAQKSKTKHQHKINLLDLNFLSILLVNNAGGKESPFGLIVVE
jgi:hypothetical protein